MLVYYMEGDAVDRASVLMAVGLILVILGVYQAYTMEVIRYSTTPPAQFDAIDGVQLQAGNFSNLGGLLEINVTPINGSFLDSYLVVNTSAGTVDKVFVDPEGAGGLYYAVNGTAIVSFSAGFSGNVTVYVLFSFTNTSVDNPVTVEFHDPKANVSSEVVVYGVP